MLRVAINGFGRIGRCLVRALYERHLEGHIELVAINDPVDPHMLAHLLRHDSTHGHFHVPVELKDNQLRIGSQSVTLLAEKQASVLPWKDLGIDLVLECSGRMKTADQLRDHLTAGADRVLASYPVEGAELTVVYGVNHQQLKAEHRLISNASCTTNCLAPIIKVLDDNFGVVSAQMTTIHAYTNDQNLIDKAHGDLYRARAAAVNLIPTRTGAAQAVALVLPHLAGRLDGMAVRVPTLNVSMVDLHCVLEQNTNVEAINQAMTDAAEDQLSGVLSVNRLPLVSSDFNHNPYSSVFDATQTRIVGNQIKIISWYDNEWGFTNRMLDMALKVSALGKI